MIRTRRKQNHRPLLLAGLLAALSLTTGAWGAPFSTTELERYLEQRATSHAPWDWQIDEENAALILGLGTPARLAADGGFFGSVVPTEGAGKAKIAPGVVADQDMHRLWSLAGKARDLKGYHHIIPLRSGAAQPELLRFVQNGDVAVFFDPAWTASDIEKLATWRTSHVALLGRGHKNGEPVVFSLESPADFSHALDGSDMTPFHIFRFVPVAGSDRDGASQAYGDNILDWALRGYDRFAFDFTFTSPPVDDVAALDKYRAQFLRGKDIDAMNCALYVYVALHLGLTSPAARKALAAPYDQITVDPFTGDRRRVKPLQNLLFSPLTTAETTRVTLDRYTATDVPELARARQRAMINLAARAMASDVPFFTTIRDRLVASLSEPQWDPEALPHTLNELATLEKTSGLAKYWLGPQHFIMAAERYDESKPGLVYVGTVVHEAFLRPTGGKRTPLKLVKATPPVAADAAITDEGINKTMGWTSGGLEKLWHRIVTEHVLSEFEIAVIDYARRAWNPGAKSVTAILHHNFYGLDPVLYRRLVVQVWNDPSRAFWPAVNNGPRVHLRSAINNLRVALASGVSSIRAGDQPLEAKTPFPRLTENLYCSSQKLRRLNDKKGCALE